MQAGVICGFSTSILPSSPRNASIGTSIGCLYVPVTNKTCCSCFVVRQETGRQGSSSRVM